MQKNELLSGRNSVNLTAYNPASISQIRTIPNKVYDKEVTKEGQNLMTFVLSKKIALG